MSPSHTFFAYFAVHTLPSVLKAREGDFKWFSVSKNWSEASSSLVGSGRPWTLARPLQGQQGPLILPIPSGSLPSISVFPVIFLEAGALSFTLHAPFPSLWTRALLWAPLLPGMIPQLRSITEIRVKNKKDLSGCCQTNPLYVFS